MKRGTHYYAEKGKSLLSIRISTDALKALHKDSVENGHIRNRLVEDIMSTIEVDVDSINLNFKDKVKWTTYIDFDLHKEIKIKAVMHGMNLKDLAGHTIERYYEKRKATKKNPTKKG